ncbi:hypothetical protein EYD10_06648 [Varanus komodoensis]|nr:hypothetical protein EYD10_06648 [Varanus komodoensis]
MEPTLSHNWLFFMAFVHHTYRLCTCMEPVARKMLRAFLVATPPTPWHPYKSRGSHHFPQLFFSSVGALAASMSVSHSSALLDVPLAHAVASASPRPSPTAGTPRARACGVLLGERKAGIATATRVAEGAAATPTRRQRRRRGVEREGGREKMATPVEWASLCEKFRSAINLSYVESKKDPETEPYRSKYSARELLEGIKQLLGSEESGEAEGVPAAGADGASERERLRAVRLAAVEYELGVNHTDTQECSAGEEHLLKCLQLLERHRLSRECVSLYIQAQNNLGILWSERDDIKTAQSYLESAEALYNQYMKEIGNPPLDSNEHFMTEEEKLSDQERSKRFEKVYTHTLYYLAQVYQHLEMIEKAAQYCHTTLKRQLEYSGYYPVEWALNAATLSQYYLRKQCFMESRHCLAAASVIFGQAGQVPSAEDILLRFLTTAAIIFLSIKKAIKEEKMG